MYNDILLSVSRPSRYIGQEINAVIKDPSRVKTRVALIFPDTYEVGMSHLGLKILYHILNNMEDVAAERAFVPWIDLEEKLNERGLPLVSIESSLPLREFDIVGFTLPYELCYTNILTALSLAAIPLTSAERDKTYPLVIGGGTAAFNPEPVAAFFDAFLLGDGEEGVVDIIKVYNKWKENGGSKEVLLRELAGIKGVYVPSLYSVEYNGDGMLHSICPVGETEHKVKRRIIEDLDKAPYPDSPPLPYMQVIHDRLTVEIARGCTHGCRFCQAGITYRPVRERSPEKIVEIVDRSLKNTGYEEVSLASLSTGDFGCLGSILTSMVNDYAGKNVSFSLPSLRLGTLTPTVIDRVTETKNKSFTIAPEAGTERLRKVINKEMDEEVFETTVNELFARGVKALKMYFMIGLPTESEEDLLGIIRLAQKVKEIGKKYGKGVKDITVSVSTFVPKPHTPFQWYGQAPMDDIERKINYLKTGLMRVRVKFKRHTVEMSFLEAVFSRGDRRLGKVIEAAWRSGCRFDSWSDRLDFNRWIEAFKQSGVDPYFYANRHIPVEELLPWEHLDTGVTGEFLIKEYQRAVEGRVIPDCRYGICPNCGVCDMEAVRGEKAEGIRPIARKPVEDTEVKRKKSSGLEKINRIPGTRHKVRIKYSKTGPVSMLSQLEVLNAFARAFRRASIPIRFSEGFHPHPRISFGPALPVGVESISEYMDVELTEHTVPSEIRDTLNRFLPRGIAILNVREVPIDRPALNSFIRYYAYEIAFEGISPAPSQDIPLVTEASELWAERFVRRDGKKILRKINTRPFIEEIRWIDKDLLFLLLRSIKGECCRSSDVISALFKTSPDNPGVRIRRTGLFGKMDGVMITPDETKEKRENTCLQR